MQLHKFFFKEVLFCLIILPRNSFGFFFNDSKLKSLICKHFAFQVSKLKKHNVTKNLNSFEEDRIQEGRASSAIGVEFWGHSFSGTVSTVTLVIDCERSLLRVEASTADNTSRNEICQLFAPSLSSNIIILAL